MNMFVTILGSGAALPIGARRCSAQVLNIGGFRLLIDCAEATQDRIRYNHLKLQSLSTIIISHLHGDHFFGLPGLLSTMHLCGRTEPVFIAAPRGARQVIETTFELTGNHVGFPIEWYEMDFTEGEQRIFEHKRCTIDAFPLDHSVPDYGFRITEVPHNDRQPLSYAYCCDTAYDERLVEHLCGVDLLCLECTFSNEFEHLAAERKHLTAGQAGRLARLAGAKQLLLTHISARYREDEPLISQARAEFENSFLAADNTRIEIKK
ncbi:MAG: ribonuclease Z [Bacteroidales bacterium]|nr:ribonuclease Z [Bacteroidales bacterium]